MQLIECIIGYQERGNKIALGPAGVGGRTPQKYMDGKLSHRKRSRAVITKFETHQILSLSTKISSFGMKKLQNLEFWHEKTRDSVNL